MKRSQHVYTAAFLAATILFAAAIGSATGGPNEPAGDQLPPAVTRSEPSGAGGPIVVSPRLGGPGRGVHVGGGGLIIDDLDGWEEIFSSWISWPYGYGFMAGGPSSGWKAVTSGTTYDNRALYTYAASTWTDRESNNWVVWAPDEMYEGTYEVSAFVPAIVTGRADTSYARYYISDGQDLVYRDVDQTNSGGWRSLGTYEFTDGWGAYVELRDTTRDAGYGRTVVVDAMRWAPPGTGEDPGSAVTVDAYLRGRPDGASVPVGTRVEFCFSVSRAHVDIRFTYCAPDGCQILAQWTDDGQGYCTYSVTGLPEGRRTITIEAFVNGRLADDDTASFWVSGGGPTVTASVPTNVPTSTPTLKPPTYTPSPTPTKTPLAANPTDLALKDELVDYLENPGVKAVLGVDVPGKWRDLVPRIRYDEGGAKDYIERFRSAGYTESELSALKRLRLAELAVQSYYNNSLELVDVASESMSKLLFGLEGMFRVLDKLRAAARELGGFFGDWATESIKVAYEVADDMLHDMLDFGIDRAVPRGSPLNEALKDGASLINIQQRKLAPDEFVKVLGENLLRTLMDYVAMNGYVLVTQGTVNDATANARAGRVSGSDSAAQARISDAMDNVDDRSQRGVAAARTAIDSADLLGTVSDVAGVVTVATGAGSNPISHAAGWIAVGAKFFESCGLAIGAGLPTGVVVANIAEIDDVGAMAFDPSRRLPAAGVNAASPGNGAPTGTIARLAEVAGPEWQAYARALSQIDGELASVDARGAGALLRGFHTVDADLHDALLLERAPVHAAVLELGESNAVVNDAALQVVENAMWYAGSRMVLEMRLALFFLDPSPGNAQQARRSVEVVRSSTDAYRAAIQAGRDATAGLSLPGHLVVRRVVKPDPSPRPSDTFAVDVELQNGGGASALDVAVEVSTTPPLMLLSASRLTVGTVPVGGTSTVSMRMRSMTETSGYVQLKVTDRTGRVMTRLVSVRVEEGDLPPVHAGHLYIPSTYNGVSPR